MGKYCYGCNQLFNIHDLVINFEKKGKMGVRRYYCYKCNAEKQNKK